MQASEAKRLAQKIGERVESWFRKPLDGLSQYNFVYVVTDVIVDHFAKLSAPSPPAVEWEERWKDMRRRLDTPEYFTLFGTACHRIAEIMDRLAPAAEEPKPEDERTNSAAGYVDELAAEKAKVLAFKSANGEFFNRLLEGKLYDNEPAYPPDLCFDVAAAFMRVLREHVCNKSELAEAAT